MLYRTVLRVCTCSNFHCPVPAFWNKQCSWSVTYWNGSGSADPYFWHPDPDPDPALACRSRLRVVHRVSYREWNSRSGYHFFCILPSVLWIRIFFLKIAIYLSLGLHKRLPRQEKPSALKRAHPALQKWNLLILLLWVIFSLRDPDPGAPLNPDHVVTTDSHRWYHTFLAGFVTS